MRLNFRQFKAKYVKDYFEFLIQEFFAIQQTCALLPAAKAVVNLAQTSLHISMPN
jgi:hypothetical protein